MESVFAVILKLGFISGALWATNKQRAAEMTLGAVMKPGETIACKNATVLVDKNGEVSWLNNTASTVILKQSETKSISIKT